MRHPGQTRRAFLARGALIAAGVAATGASRRAWASGRADQGLGAADVQAMRDVAHAFMDAHHVPGLSVAIARHGQLVHADGLGVANPATPEAVTPAHLFRIASVTKPFTSTTIFSLIDQGRLRLTDRIFGRQAILGDDFGGPPFKPYVEDVTLYHLLTHSAGGWPNDDTDPMFRNPGMDHRQLITWTLQNIPLTHEPGTHYAYSNFGYSVLGRVIEKVARRSYADAVHDAVLDPCGITTMRIAGNTLADRAPGEVVYVGQGGENPYRMQVARMDSHGGWIATATDLVRFLLRVDAFPTPPDRLKPDTLRTMTTPSAANAGYACGWMVNARHNWWHNGSLPGTTTIMVRTAGGFCWAALTNTREPRSTIGPDLDRMMWSMVRSVWPNAG